MESNTKPVTETHTDRSNSYEELKTKIKLMKQRSDSVRFHRDTDNLDFGEER